MSAINLINYLRLKGPHNLECVPTASEENAPPPGDELIYELGDPKEEGDDLIEIGHREEQTWGKTRVRRNPWRRRILRRIPKRTPRRT